MYIHVIVTSYDDGTDNPPMIQSHSSWSELHEAQEELKSLVRLDMHAMNDTAKSSGEEPWEITDSNSQLVIIRSGEQYIAYKIVRVKLYISVGGKRS